MGSASGQRAAASVRRGTRGCLRVCCISFAEGYREQGRVYAHNPDCKRTRCTQWQRSPQMSALCTPRPNQATAFTAHLFTSNTLLPGKERLWNQEMRCIQCGICSCMPLLPSCICALPLMSPQSKYLDAPTNLVHRPGYRAAFEQLSKLETDMWLHSATTM